MTTYDVLASTAVDARPRSGVVRFHLTMAAIAAALIGADIALCSVTRITGYGAVLRDCLFADIMLAVVWAYGPPKFGRTAEMGAWLGWIMVGVAVLVQIAGRTAAPLADVQLAGVDRMMGWNTADMVSLMAHQPVLRIGFALAYGGVFPLVFAAVLVPCLMGRWQATAQYLVAVTIAGILTAALFSIYPAVGPWTVYGYSPAADQANAQSYLHTLKTAGPLALGDFRQSGVVSFPSFHCVLAILSAAALWPIRRLRWIACSLAIAICISTVTTGWHYGIDVIGGIVVALGSQWAARRVV